MENLKKKKMIFFSFEKRKLSITQVEPYIWEIKGN